MSPVALRLACWAPLGCFRCARCAARPRVNCFGGEPELPRAVGAVGQGMNRHQKFLFVLLVDKSRYAKDARRIGGRMITIELASQCVQQGLRLRWLHLFYSPDHLV